MKKKECHIQRMVRVYDVKEHKLIHEFESIAEAVTFTGVNQSRIYHAIKGKMRVRKNKLNKIITFR